MLSDEFRDAMLHEVRERMVPNHAMIHAESYVADLTANVYNFYAELREYEMIPCSTETYQTSSRAKWLHK